MDESLIGRYADGAREHRPDGEREQRDGHDARRFVRMFEEMRVARLPVEGEPYRAGDIERGKPAGEETDQPEDRIAVAERGAPTRARAPRMGRLLTIWRSWSVWRRVAVVGGGAGVVAVAGIVVYFAVVKRPADVACPAPCHLKTQAKPKKRPAML